MSDRLKFRVSIYKLMCVVFLLVLVHGILMLLLYTWSGRDWLASLPFLSFSNYWPARHLATGNSGRADASLAKAYGAGRIIEWSPHQRHSIQDNTIDDDRRDDAELKRRNGSKLKSDDVLWKLKLKKKLFQKMRAMSANESGSPNDVIRPMPFVELPLADVWNVSTLNDYFTDVPDCAISRPASRKNGDNSIPDVKERAAVRPFLLIIVTSSPENFEERDAIRQSWGRPSNDTRASSNRTREHPMATPPWKTLFLVGRAETENADTLSVLLDNEMRRHGDLLLGDYLDTYRNLTLKVLHGLQYAATRCRPDYLLKADDDVFVNVPLLVDFLARYNTQPHRLYAGHVSYQAKVIRNSDSRWHVDRQVYAPDRYPPYALGGGYVISGDLLQPLLSTAARLAPFPNEDAYVGILMNVLRVSPVHSSRFTLYHFRWSECNLLYLMGIHNVKPRQQAVLLATALRARQNCSGQKRIKTWR